MKSAYTKGRSAWPSSEHNIESCTSVSLKLQHSCKVLKCKHYNCQANKSSWELQVKITARAGAILTSCTLWTCRYTPPIYSYFDLKFSQCFCTMLRCKRFVSNFWCADSHDVACLLVLQSSWLQCGQMQYFERG